MYRHSILIGIPTLNGPARLHRCLKSIEDCTRWDLFERVKVVVCDDGSTEDNVRVYKDVMQACERVRNVAHAELILSPGRCGISKTWNKLARHQPSDVIVLLNDDVELVDRWLDVLVYSVTENACAGMVGLNSYGAVTKAQVRKHLDHGREDVLDHVRELQVDYREAKLQSGGGSLLSSQGYAFAMRRDVYEAAGGFDERFFCFYEELDLGVTLRHKGYWHFTASYPIIYHLGGATNSVSTNMDASQHMRESKDKFHEKWGGKTLTQLRDELTRPPPPLREWHSQRANWQ